MTELSTKIEQATEPSRELTDLTVEQIGTYRRAFIENRADYIVVDGWQLQKQWVQDDIEQLTELGLLIEDQATSERESDGQYTAICYRPSPRFLEALKARNPTT